MADKRTYNEKLMDKRGGPTGVSTTEDQAKRRSQDARHEGPAKK